MTGPCESFSVSVWTRTRFQLVAGMCGGGDEGFFSLMMWSLSPVGV